MNTQLNISFGYLTIKSDLATEDERDGVRDKLEIIMQNGTASDKQKAGEAWNEVNAAFPTDIRAHIMFN
jgi:hypothetical protein